MPGTLRIVALSQFFIASALASQCPTGHGLNDTSGVNVNVNFGNCTGEDTNKQITQIYNINSPKEPGCKGDSCLLDDYESPIEI